MSDPQTSDQLLAERAEAVLANCKDCGCEECIRIRNELIADFLKHIRDDQ